MYLPSVNAFFSGLTPTEIYPYSTFGKPELRKKWREKMIAENPLLTDKDFGTPIVTLLAAYSLIYSLPVVALYLFVSWKFGFRFFGGIKA